MEDVKPSCSSLRNFSGTDRWLQQVTVHVRVVRGCDQGRILIRVRSFLGNEMPLATSSSHAGND